MSTLRRIWPFNRSAEKDAAIESDPVTPATTEVTLDIEIAPNDPLLVYLQQATGPVDIETLALNSDALQLLREAGVKLVVPLISQGELIGMINMGARLSEQDYSSDDRRLLTNLATQAAPALRVAQLARQQQLEATERERLAQELRVARIIQQTLLPQSLPDLDGWALTAHYQPAREVGGDFYDFLYFDDGRVGIVIGDVTDKGVPAALVMATTRTLLRAVAERLASPGQVLERVNDLLHPDIPPKMFVTCLLAVLDPVSGKVIFANAGHDVPYHHTANGVEELRATGMPLGLMPGMTYEEKETTLSPGDTVLFYSDGLVEAHAPDREMFGFPRLKEMVAEHPGGAELVGYLLNELATFTGAGWEQEDDVTLVVLECVSARTPQECSMNELLATFEVASAPGNERAVMERVAELVAPLGMEPARLDRLKTAVAEATMNAMEHGNEYREELPVIIEVRHSPESVSVRITDQGSDASPEEVEAPDLLAKLSGEQSPRGWGLFLIKNMVDEMNTSSDGSIHTIELIMNLSKGADHAD